jgi:hypothetical protein
LLVGAPVAAELACRFVLGLGDPPLYTRDAQIEYLPTPGRYARFGHTVSYNSASMRATPELAPKPAPGERRVLVLGDSVPNAGAKLDDREVGTVALQTLLNAADAGGAAPAERWTVLNASSGSWGPPNLLAYARRFGLFGADTVVIVLNDGDAWDVPTFAGSLGPDFPERRPVLALGEAFGRYLPRLLARIRPSATGAPAEPAPGDLKASLSALRELIELARASGAGVAVVLHADRDELTRGPGEGTGLLEAACRGLGVPVFSTAPAMRAALKAGSGPYDGSIHLTASGQGVLAGVMLEAARASAAPAR